MKPPVYLVAAVDENYGLGKRGELPWRLKGDLAYFQKLTTVTDDPRRRNMVVMGRKTWDSLPSSSRPLAKRLNVVLTRRQDLLLAGEAKTASSLAEAFALADHGVAKIFVIGGGELYAAAIDHPRVQGIYLTKIAARFDCDTFFPSLPSRFHKSESLGRGQEGALSYEYFLFTA